ncbi:hypothetical protein MSA_18720 [Streptococcus agalactiae ILRI005]|nr:hypothetical protein MSA_18720 [Streptococcus agalactiae ILRI005]
MISNLPYYVDNKFTKKYKNSFHRIDESYLSTLEDTIHVYFGS